MDADGASDRKPPRCADSGPQLCRLSDAAPGVPAYDEQAQLSSLDREPGAMGLSRRGNPARS